MAWRIVIAGGGFGGFYAARALERLLPANSARVTLVNEANFMLYTPLLPGAAGATLDPRHVVVPLRSQLRHTDLLIGAVTGGDPVRSTLAVRRLDGEPIELGYDQLIVALGSVSRTLPIPGLAEHAIGFKSLSDATALRNRVLSCMDIAESLEDPAGARSTWGSCSSAPATRASRGWPSCRTSPRRRSSCIPAAARRECAGCSWRRRTGSCRRSRGACRSSRRASCAPAASRCAPRRRSKRSPSATRRSRAASGFRRARWCGRRGSSRARPSSRLGLPCDRGGRVTVDRTMRVGGLRARLGDRRLRRGARPGAQAGQPCPPTAQHAIRQGRLVAGNVAATLGNGRVRPFRYRTKGVVAELGDHQAVALTLGLRWRGLPAWFIARTYHLLLMPGFGTQAALADRLERRAAVRPRHVRPGPPGRPDAAVGRRRRLTGVS